MNTSLIKNRIHALFLCLIMSLSLVSCDGTTVAQLDREIAVKQAELEEIEWKMYSALGFGIGFTLTAAGADGGLVAATAGTYAKSLSSDADALKQDIRSLQAKRKALLNK